MAYTFFTSFKKTLNKSSSRCMYRQMNSAKYVEKRCFRTPNLGRFDFACLQCPSILLVWSPSLFYRVVHCSVFIAMRLEFGVRFPAVRHYNCSRFNPVLNNGQQCVFVSLLDCHQKTFPAFLLYTSKHPLPLNVMSSVVLSFAKFTFVYLNNLSFSA